MLAKTENAEVIHQEMLRDICKYLGTRFIELFESTSIDLMIDWNGMRIYEIKSATLENIIAQCAKCSFQLAYYLEALTEKFRIADFALIVHKIDNDSIQEFCIQTLTRLGIKCLVYDPLHEWPNRLPGFCLNVQ